MGGRGTRLGILGKKLPKTLVKINNRPILWYIIKSLVKNSFNHFIFPTGYKGTMIKNYVTKNFSNKKFEDRSDKNRNRFKYLKKNI